jgi:ABC-type lipoprotein release transport system permease subunit
LTTRLEHVADHPFTLNQGTLSTRRSCGSSSAGGFINPADPVTYAAVAGLPTVVTLMACAVPARRAMRLDAVVALRQD